MTKICDYCGQSKRIKKYSRKQLLKREKIIDVTTKKREDEDGKEVNFTVRKTSWIEKMIPTKLKKINDLLKILEKKHGFSRKSKLCDDCARKWGVIE